MTSKVIRYTAIICIMMVVAACGNTPTETEGNAAPQAKSTTPKTNYSCVPFEVNGGWGYDIYIDTTRYVHQEHIPAINGMFPFASETDAFNTGTLAIKKLEQGIVPPTVTVEEMMEMGVVIPL